MDEVKKTAGQIITEFNEKQSSVYTGEQAITPAELIKEGKLKNFDKNLELVIEYGKKAYGKDFYIERRTWHEWALGGPENGIIKARATCPTPHYMQTAIKYHFKEEAIEYLWTIPAKWQFAKYKRNALTLNLTDQKILKYILEFEDGTLDHKTKILNKEPLNREVRRISLTTGYTDATKKTDTLNGLS